MRTQSLLFCSLLLAATGCSRDFCEYYLGGACDADGGAGAGGADDGGGPQGGAGAQGGEGGGGAPPAGCTPAEGEPIGPGCGVFVKAGATGDGSQLSPFGTVTEAVAGLGQATHVYICGGDTFEGSIELPGDVSVHGSLDCESWEFKAANPKPEILGSADTPAITIGGSGSGALSFLRVRSPDAVAPGASSIAVQVNGAETAISDCELRAGLGATGAAGAVQPKVATPAAANGGTGDGGCDGLPAEFGGQPGLNSCPGSVNGGTGGNGLNSSPGGGGGDGQPLGPLGQGGFGEEEQGAATPCTNGGLGQAGAAGGPGPGAAADDIGTLSADTYSPPTAPAGMTPGIFGQGGGGGGGANQCGAMGAGPGGGGGGAGGCGGSPGNGGQGGGGSFALISISAAVSLDNATLAAQSGGIGGAGDAGQEGMDGGSGGNPGTPSSACPGGPGGKGGRGGAGGGGRGGPSVGIAYVGDAPTETGTIDITTAAAPASGGPGGNGGAGNIGGTGADGINELRKQWP